MQITNEEQAQAARELLAAWHRGIELRQILEIGSYTDIGNLKSALADYERGAQEREFAKIELSDVAQKRLALICVMEKNADGHDELLKHGLEDKLDGSDTLAPTDKGRRFVEYLASLDKKAPAQRELKCEVWCKGLGDDYLCGAFPNDHEAKLFMNMRKELAAKVYSFEVREVSTAPAPKEII